ncbi:Lmo0850 family protein [Brochothrix campestris]|uniref:Lmo0850 family protein n=2 Tax=Brochothrix campestris TaxID=2757 RepID=UPI0004B70F13|nr:Lmo0850 family protein [Brochothrix campestris]
MMSKNSQIVEANLNSVIQKLKQQGISVAKTKSRHDVWQSIVQRGTALAIVPARTK